MREETAREKLFKIYILIGLHIWFCKKGEFRPVSHKPDQTVNDPQWLVDVITKVKEVNVTLQGKEILCS